MADLKFYLKYSKNPLVCAGRNIVYSLKSRRLNSTLRGIFQDDGLKVRLKEKGIAQVVLWSCGYEALTLVPKPTLNDSWMGIGRMFYGNVETYEYSDHPVREDNGRLVFDDAGKTIDLARYLVSSHADVSAEKIRRRIRDVK